MDAYVSCPFRKGAKLGYDADAMMALDDGHAPACHERVGLGRIFHTHEPTCQGFEAYLRREPGFRPPKLVA